MNEIIETFESMNIKIIEDENKLKWMNANDVAKALEYVNPVVSSNDFIKSNKELLESWIRQFLIQHESGKKTTWYLSKEGVIAFIVKSNSKKAVEFQRWAVKKLSEVIDNEHIKKENTLRLKSKQVRNLFTDTLKEHDISKPQEYIQLTYQTKINLGIDKNKKKNNCDLLELCKITMAETLSIYEIESKNVNGYNEIKPVVIDSSKKVNNLPLNESLKEREIIE